MSITKEFLRTKEFILGGAVSMYNDDIKAALLQPGFQYSTSLVSFEQIRGLEIDSTVHYPSGGISIIGVNTITNPDTLKAEMRISPIEYPLVTAEVGACIIYAEKTTTGGIQNPLLVYTSFPNALEFQSSIFRMNWPSPILRW